MLDLFDSEATRWAIGTLITLAIGLGAIFVQVVLSRRRKNLWYWSLVYPVVHEEIEDRVEVLFDGQHVPNAYVAVIGLHYRGNEPIVENDYRNRISFDFGHAQVLSAEVIYTEPNGINASVDIRDENKVVFDPVALNDGNEIAVRVLTTGRNFPTASGHIVGIKEIRDQRLERDWSVTSLYFMMGLVVLTLGVVLVGLIVDPSVEVIVVRVGFVAVTISLAIFTALWIGSWLARR